MRPRAIADLTQLNDENLLAEVSRGMSAVLRNALGLLSDGRVLADAGRDRSADLLTRIAEEEAAKYHILLDAVRCPRNGVALSRQLRRFNDHLAKGIYAQYVGIAPASYGEVLSFLDRLRRTLYLDGPNDIDWIFRNDILREREEALYVDYVDFGGEHRWIEPSELARASWGVVEPPSVRLAERLSTSGFDKPEALAVIADVWRGIEFVSDDHWMRCHGINVRTLNALKERGLFAGSDDALHHIAWEWLFPLHAADLTPIEVDRKDLESIQRAWYPDY